MGALSKKLGAVGQATFTLVRCSQITCMQYSLHKVDEGI